MKQCLCVLWMLGVVACQHGVGSAWAQGAALPSLARPVVSPGGVSLTWTGSGAGWDYAVQARESLVDGTWLMVYEQEPWPTPATGWMDQRPWTGPTRFYRVVAVPHAERGRFLSAAAGSTYPIAFINWLFQQAGINLTAQYAVTVRKVVYETVDPFGGRTVASGALALPVGVSGALPLVSYQHGTLTRTNDAPSRMAGEEVYIGIAFASGGYAAALPDYLGLGDSPGLHPYQHARSEATASVDMLRATRSFCASNNVPLNGQVFICGYSQGGHATLALQREIETFHTNEFSLAASAPMAGAYDMSGVTTDDFLSDRPMPNPYYFVYLLAAYQQVYHLADQFADLLASPYDQTLPPLMNGQASGGQINAAVPSDPKLILKPEVLEAFRTNPRHPLRVALWDNDLYRWTPRVPTRLYHCQGDQDVIFANTQVAYASFQSRGATQVQLVNPLPGGDHGDCAMPSMLLAKQWFDQLRR